MDPTIIDKAFVYLMRGNDQLLLLSYPDHPRAGIQVPAGTVEPGETPAQAAARELHEETGLTRFELTAFLGRTLFDLRTYGRNEIHRRHIFAARMTGPAPDRWFHSENHADMGQIRFDLFWWTLGDAPPPLIAGHGELIYRLNRQFPL